MQTFNPRRPAMSKEIVAAALTKYSEQFSVSPEALDDIRFNYSTDDNGYTLAKKLEERCGWDIDSEMVVELEEVRSFVEDAHADAVLAWVAEHDIKASLKVGQRVRFKHGFELHEGTIDELATSKRDAACYLIVKDGDENHPNKRRSIVKYECVELIQ